MLLDRENWSKKLKSFVASTQASMKLAAELAISALEHFAKHGDVIYLNELLEAIPENYGRRAAFTKWAGDHAPLGMVNGKFVKDKAKAEKTDWDNEDGEVKAGLIKKAEEKTFWDYTPAPKPVIVDADDVVGNLFAMINRLRNTKTHDPTPQALQTLSVVEGFAMSLKSQRDEAKKSSKPANDAGQGNKEEAA